MTTRWLGIICIAWVRTPDRMLDRLAGEYVDSAVAANQRYKYRICTVNPQGEESEPSHVVSITTFEAVAPPPGAVRVTIEGQTVLVKWNASRLQDLQGYRLYRREEGNPAVPLGGELFALTSGEYRDRTASKGKKYYYSISTVDKWGRESEQSAEVEFLNR